MPKKKSKKAKDRKVADLSADDDSQTKLNFSAPKGNNRLKQQKKCSEVDTLCVDGCMTGKEKEPTSIRSALEEGGRSSTDFLEQAQTFLKPIPHSTPLSQRLHPPRLLTGARCKGTAGGVGESSVTTKRRKPLNSCRFTPCLRSLPPPKGQSQRRKPRVCSGGRATGASDFLSLADGAKKNNVREESVVLLDSEEEEEQEMVGVGSKEGDKVIHTAIPKGSASDERARRGVEEKDEVAVLDDCQGSQDSGGVGGDRRHLQVVQDGSSEALCLSLDEEIEGESEESEPEAMDTSSGPGGIPEVEGMEVDEKTIDTCTNAEEGDGHKVDMVLLSDDEKSAGTKQTRGSPTLSKMGNAGNGSPTPSLVPSKMSEKFRVTPSKPTRMGDTTPTDHWEPRPVHFAHAPRKRSRTRLDASPASGEGEGCKKRSESKVKEGGLQGKEKEFGGEEKEFGGEEKVEQEKDKLPGMIGRKGRNAVAEQVELDEGELLAETAQRGERKSSSSHLMRSGGIVGSGWDEEEEDPLIVEGVESQKEGQGVLEVEGKHVIDSDEDGLVLSSSPPRKTPLLQDDVTRETAGLVTEVKTQISLSLKHRSKCLSPLQERLNAVTSMETKGREGMQSFYSANVRPLSEQTWKNSRQPPSKEAKDNLFKLRNKAGKVSLKKNPEDTTPLNADDMAAQRNPFSKGANVRTAKVKQSEQIGAPRLSTELEFLSNDQELCAGDIQLGTLRLVAVSSLHISSNGVDVSGMANGVMDQLHLQLRWDDLLSVKLYFKTLPGLVVLRPTGSGASKLQYRLTAKRIRGVHVKADGSNVQRYVVIQLTKPVPSSVQKDVIKILQQRWTSSKEFFLTEEEVESFLNMVDKAEIPLQSTSDYALQQRRSICPTSTPSIIDSLSDSDDDTSMPDVSASLSRRPLKTYGQSSVNLCTESQRPRRRSTRNTPGFKLPSDLPHIDFTFRPQNGNQAIRVLSDDLRCLEEGEFLNDTVINFYLMYLWDKLPADQRESVYILSSFFFTRLSNTKLDGSKGVERTPEREHARVKNWTKSVDIFSKSILIVPVCYMSHWFLFLVLHPSEYDKDRRARELERKKLLQKKSKRKSSTGSSRSVTVTATLDVDSSYSEVEESRGSQREGTEDSIDITSSVTDQADNVEEEAMQSSILVLDSLGGRRPRLALRLAKYLTEEWRCKKDSEDVDHFQGFPVEYPEVPLQPNSSDCGIYLLHFVQELFEGLTSGQSVLSGGQFEWSNPPEDFRKKLFTLVTEINSQKNGMPQNARPQNVADS